MTPVIDWPDLPALQQPAWPPPTRRRRARRRCRRYRRWCSPARATTFAGSWPGWPVANLRAHGRGLRRDVRGEHRRLHQVAAQDPAADGSRVDLRLGDAGGEDRSTGRAVLQARSSAAETRDGITLPSYLRRWRERPGLRCGFQTPGLTFGRGLQRLSAALNLVRAFPGGYADLRQVHAWNQDFVRDSPPDSVTTDSPVTSTVPWPSLHACGKAR